MNPCEVLLGTIFKMVMSSATRCLVLCFLVAVLLSSSTISKVKAQECSIYEGCNQCLGASDPNCGWCSLENKCSLRSDCRDATQHPQHWVSYKTGRCTTITQVMPEEIPITTARTLSLMIDNLPSVEGSLLCVFSALGKHLPTEAKRTAQGVSCTTPRSDFLPYIPRNEHHFTTKLSVRKTEGPEFVSTNFTFFDCNTYSSCTECVSSPFPCDWCVDGHRCTHDSAENCRNDILVNGVNRVGPSIRSGPSFCPRITFVESQEILVSSGTEKSVKVKVDNIAQFITQTRFVCQFNIEGRVTSVNAQLLSDTMYCDRMEFTYSRAAPSSNVTFAVIWGGSKPLDNPDNIHVLVYQCHLMADNCGMCLSLPERYRCSWCQSTSRCEVQDQCLGGSAASWLDRESTCPPWDGGTNVTTEETTISYEEVDPTVPSGDITVNECKALLEGILESFKEEHAGNVRRLEERVQQLEIMVLDGNKTLERILNTLNERALDLPN